MGTGKCVEEGEHGYREECGGGGTWVQRRVWRRGNMSTGKSVEEGEHGYREECGGGGTWVQGRVWRRRNMGTGKSVEEGEHVGWGGEGKKVARRSTIPQRRAVLLWLAKELLSSDSQW